MHGQQVDGLETLLLGGPLGALKCRFGPTKISLRMPKFPTIRMAHVDSAKGIFCFIRGHVGRC